MRKIDRFGITFAIRTMQHAAWRIDGKERCQMRKPEGNVQLKTLIIDDDPHVRNTFELLFEEIGWSLQTAPSAEEGLELLERGDYDIIVSDFGLPEMNGLEFFQQAMIACPASIHILMSANGDDEVISRAYEIGLDDFLQKPYTLETLLATIAVHVRKTRAVYGDIPATALAAA
jgi:DNA-binding response OmpR family regulator